MNKKIHFFGKETKEIEHFLVEIKADIERIKLNIKVYFKIHLKILFIII